MWTIHSQVFLAPRDFIPYFYCYFLQISISNISSLYSIFVYLCTIFWSVQTYNIRHIFLTAGKQSSWLFQTYLIGHCNPSVRIIDLVSHTTYVVCVNFIDNWRDLQFLKSTPNDRFLRSFSWQIYLLSGFLPEICGDEIAEEIFFIFCFDVWPGAGTLAFRLISQHTCIKLNHMYVRMIRSA